MYENQPSVSTFTYSSWPGSRDLARERRPGPQVCRCRRRRSSGIRGQVRWPRGGPSIIAIAAISTATAAPWTRTKLSSACTLHGQFNARTAELIGCPLITGGGQHWTTQLLRSLRPKTANFVSYGNFSDDNTSMNKCTKFYCQSLTVRVPENIVMNLNNVRKYTRNSVVSRMWQPKCM